MELKTATITSPFVMVIFGATGDLTQRKLLPSLFHLFRKKLLPEHFYLVGFSRREYDGEEFKAFLTDAIKKYYQHEVDEKAWNEFLGKWYYQQGDFDHEAGYLKLIDKLKEFDDLLKSCVPRFFYLATPPDKYASILNYLHTTKLSEGCGQGSDKWTKIMIEKPFGKSLEDATALDSKLAQFFKEEQIYRIDHYLGKETVQNILAFRFANLIFSPAWDRRCIDHIQISVTETLGVETRGNFFEGVGTLRDFAQSHLLELLTAVIMKEPQRFDAEGIRTARTKSIEQLISIQPEEVGVRTVRGQYGRQLSAVSHQPSAEMIGYREEANVFPNSNTETYVALKLHSADPKWEGVPFYLRTGKRLAKKATEISIVFKESPLKMLQKITDQVDLVPNVLTFRIEPNEGIELTLNAKKIGFETVFESVPMSFIYKKEKELTGPYERLLIDAMRGDQTLFTRTDEVAAAWRIISNISKGWWNQGVPGFPNYAAGSWGPTEAEELIKKDGREWLLK